MNPSPASSALQLCEPVPESIYGIDLAARLAHVPRRMVLVYCKHGLIAPVRDPAQAGFQFNGETVRNLRRMEELRSQCAANMEGIKLIHELLNEVERLRAEVRRLQS